MRYKNGLVYKVSEIKTYEIDLPKETLIERLIEQDGICRDDDSNGYPIRFLCFKNGEFLVTGMSNDYDSRQFFLQGETVGENGKTKIRVESVKNKSRPMSSVTRMVFNIIYTIICIALLIITGTVLEPQIILMLVLLLVMSFVSVNMSFKERKAIPYDQEIVLREVERRINGAIHWDK